LHPVLFQTPVTTKKGICEDKWINQVLAEMQRNAEVALGLRAHCKEISEESLTVQGKEKDGGGAFRTCLLACINKKRVICS